MDKNSIKKFAVWARRELISRVSQKALQYGISENEIVDVNADTVNGHLLTSGEKNQRQKLVSRVKQIGYQQTMEEAAYTWFNRFSALRFMEVNGYLPTHIRVFTDEENAFKPQILTEAIHLELDGLNVGKVYEMKDQNKTDELYKYLLITQCNALSAILPGMFTRIEDYTELLFPDNLLREGSVIEQMISMIPEKDWNINTPDENGQPQGQVQIIGWLYQYYNAEPKDKVFENLKKNIKISKENIPAATQLFTPDWIVRYMVENSLGRLWVEGHPNDELKANWKYYLEEAKQEPEVQAQLAEIRKEYANLKPEEIKVIDPCMGSGHILVYMFDVLVQIYESYGYNAREAAGLILQNNLYGLDIDDRAAQLAYFAVMMKARQYDRRIFSRGIQPHVYAIVESNGIRRDTLDYFEKGDANLKKSVETIVKELHDAKEYGSILNVTQVDFATLYARLDEIKEDTGIFAATAQNELRPLIEVAEVMARKYHTVVTNPPYAGAAGLNVKLSDFLKKYYPNSKSDLFATFIEKCIRMTQKSGKTAMITQQAWMFLSSYETLRGDILNSQAIETMIHLGNGAFGMADFGLTAFTIQNVQVKCYIGKYFRLVESNSPEWKESAFLERKHCSTSNQSNFSKIPGSPVAYWVSKQFMKAFCEGILLGKIADSKQGLATADNNRFLRLWTEVDIEKVKFDAKNLTDASNSGKKWFPYNKGGEFRRWYGNNDYLVNWENDGYEIKHIFDDKGRLRSRPQNLEYMFRPSVSWSLVSSGAAAFRYKPSGHLFDIGGMSFFTNSHFKYLLALSNTRIVYEMLLILAPTINFQCGDIANIPVYIDEEKEPQIETIVTENISISKSDWDSFELSWDFVKHPLVKNVSTVEEAYNQWNCLSTQRFNNLKDNERILNQLFIEIYGVGDEISPNEDE